MAGLAGMLFFAAPVVSAVAGASGGAAVSPKHPVIGAGLGALVGVGVGYFLSFVVLKENPPGGNASTLGTSGPPRSLPIGTPRTTEDIFQRLGRV